MFMPTVSNFLWTTVPNLSCNNRDSTAPLGPSGGPQPSARAIRIVSAQRTIDAYETSHYPSQIATGHSIATPSERRRFVLRRRAAAAAADGVTDGRPARPGPARPPVFQVPVTRSAIIRSDPECLRFALHLRSVEQTIRTTDIEYR